jgi:hypothetical protein
MTHNPNVKSEHGGFAFVIHDHTSNEPWIHSELAGKWLSRYNEMKWQQTGKCSINKLNGVSAWKDIGVSVDASRDLFLLLNHWVPMPVRQLDPMAVATWIIACMLPEHLVLRITNDTLPNLFGSTTTSSTTAFNASLVTSFNEIRQNISVEFRKKELELPLGIKLYNVTTRDTKEDDYESDVSTVDPANDATNDSVRSVRISASASFVCVVICWCCLRFNALLFASLKDAKDWTKSDIESTVSEATSGALSEAAAGAIETMGETGINMDSLFAMVDNPSSSSTTSTAPAAFADLFPSSLFDESAIDDSSTNSMGELGL